MKPIAGINRERAVSWLRGDEELLFVAGLPVVNQMTVSARALIAEVARGNAFAFGEERDTIVVGDFCPAHRFSAAVPHAENNSSLGRTVHLHPEITAMPATRLVVSGDGIFDAGDFAIK